MGSTPYYIIIEI